MAEPWLFFYSNIPGSQGDRESGFFIVPLAFYTFLFYFYSLLKCENS